MIVPHGWGAFFLAYNQSLKKETVMAYDKSSIGGPCAPGVGNLGKPAPASPGGMEWKGPQPPTPRPGDKGGDKSIKGS